MSFRFLQASSWHGLQDFIQHSAFIYCLETPETHWG